MSGGFHRLARYVSSFPSVRVLCLGDVMLDRYVYGKVSRVSAEAPVPIMSHQSECLMLGAVGNVARNVAALGGKAMIVAIVGDDESGRNVSRLISEEPNLHEALVSVRARRTTVKTRFIARGQQLLRADEEDTWPPGREVEEQVVEAFRSALGDADVVVLSDYVKGCLSDRVLSEVIGAAREAQKPIIADPKAKDPRRYNGSDLIKPNAAELESVTGIACTSDDAAEAAARSALERTDIGAVLVTRSEHGMTLVERGAEARHFKERASEVYDVSGAGDTALAVVGLAVGAGASLAEAAELANKTCNIVVSKVGTAVVHAVELIQTLQSAEFESAGAKVNPLPVAVDKVVRWRAQGARIGFTNGCFDLIHAGHVSLLDQAKENCDRLIVGINSDDSVRRLKGEGRPINSEMARAAVLASFSVVDAVVLFADDTPMRLIEAIRPDVLVKGADYAEDQVVGAEFVKSYGGRVFLAQLAPAVSTTETIDRIRG
jgi:D-beta-D-heptose 7-phosphate kinase/D-beta-D-heptose 1-phosphate adenosyltransferase